MGSGGLGAPHAESKLPLWTFQKDPPKCPITKSTEAGRYRNHPAVGWDPVDGRERDRVQAWADAPPATPDTRPPRSPC